MGPLDLATALTARQTLVAGSDVVKRALECWHKQVQVGLYHVQHELYLTGSVPAHHKDRFNLPTLPLPNGSVSLFV